MPDVAIHLFAVIEVFLIQQFIIMYILKRRIIVKKTGLCNLTFSIYIYYKENWKVVFTMFLFLVSTLKVNFLFNINY